MMTAKARLHGSTMRLLLSASLCFLVLSASSLRSEGMDPRVDSRNSAIDRHHCILSNDDSQKHGGEEEREIVGRRGRERGGRGARLSVRQAQQQSASAASAPPAGNAHLTPTRPTPAGRNQRPHAPLERP